ncbi:MAG: type 1 glutamine amidotransferase [Pseudomonadota bacterium]
MRLGILMTGQVNETLVDQVGEVDEMFATLYRAADPSVEVETFAVLDGVLPPAPDACDAWLVTGSKHGVYEDLPWLPPLKEFLRAARAAGVPLIGICFGHQLFAEAFGGRAEKFDGGWGCGVHDYRIDTQAPWMGDADGGFLMHAMHQDQVTSLPEDATVLASSPFCANAMVAYGDVAMPDAISVQPHPEFTHTYAAGLLDLRGGLVIPEKTTATARASLNQSTDGLAFARWSLAYARAAISAQKAA